MGSKLQPEGRSERPGAPCTCAQQRVLPILQLSVEPLSAVPLQVVPTVTCSTSQCKLEAQVLIQSKVIVPIVGNLPEPEAITFQVCNYSFQEKTGRWVFLSVPSTLSPGWVGAGSQLQAVSFSPLFCWTQNRKPLNQVIKECALWQQPQHLGSHTGAQILFTETLVTWGGTEGEHDDGACWLLRCLAKIAVDP